MGGSKRKLDELYDTDSELISVPEMVGILLDEVSRIRAEDQVTVAVTGLGDNNLTLSYVGEGWFAKWEGELPELAEIMFEHEHEEDMAATVTAEYGEIAVTTISR